MAMANRNLIGVFVTKLWPAQALACGGGDCGDGGGGATKNIIPPNFSNFGGYHYYRNEFKYMENNAYFEIKINCTEYITNYNG